jgi:hypothetical protein
VVDFEDGVVEREAGEALLEPGVVKEAEAVEGLVVDTKWEDEVEEDGGGDGASPGHLMTGLEGGADVGEVKSGVVVGEVTYGHVGVEEGEGFAFLEGEGGLVEAGEEGAVGEGGLFAGEVGTDLGTVGGGRDEVGGAGGEGEEKEEEEGAGFHGLMRCRAKVRKNPQSRVLFARGVEGGGEALGD